VRIDAVERAAVEERGQSRAGLFGDHEHAGFFPSSAPAKSLDQLATTGHGSATHP
jgi:hypothetical protein